MGVSLATVTRITELIAAAEFPGVSLDGIVSRSDDGMRVEVLLTVEHREPAHLLLNLARSGEHALECDLRGKLSRALLARA